MLLEAGSVCASDYFLAIVSTQASSESSLVSPFLTALEFSFPKSRLRGGAMFSVEIKFKREIAKYRWKGLLRCSRKSCFDLPKTRSDRSQSKSESKLE